MDLHSHDAKPGAADGYLIGPRQAWFAFAMTIGLMMVDYIDRQVIVSLFPHLKEAWGLSDKQLGALVSAVSVTVASGAIPIALEPRARRTPTINESQRRSLRSAMPTARASSDRLRTRPAFSARTE